ncbi:MAG TPA: hypothetical protein DDW54_02785 [Clostridiales bacterium]|nr:hypothetical protein [Clostridiales bacterium]
MTTVNDALIEKGKQLTMADYLAMAPKFEPVVDYNTKLSNFEGPLDLLLYLVNRAQIEIREIFVSEVTEQFIAYVNQAEDMDMEKESEYLNMAATLLELKSKSVLPVVEFDDGFDEEYDDQEDLYQKLEEYKLFKEVSAKLKEHETTDIFYKEPDENADDIKVVYKDFNLDGLIKALSDVLSRNEIDNRLKNDKKEIPKDVFTVADKVKFIKDTMLKREKCSFYELFEKHATRNEIITTFQALLELLKLQYLSVSQDGTFNDITIILREDRSEEEIGDFSEYN